MGSLYLSELKQSGRRAAEVTKKLSLLCLLTIIVSSCGVKGDPLPPETPPQIGTGEPNFKGGISLQGDDEDFIEEELEE